jgi:hypothetical protein
MGAAKAGAAVDHIVMVAWPTFAISFSPTDRVRVSRFHRATTMHQHV